MRGIPTTKIGARAISSLRQVRVGRSRQDLREETRDRVEQALVPLESIPCGRMLASIAGEQVRERLVAPPQVLQFLGERVTQVQFGVGIERTRREQPFEPREVVTLWRLPSGRRERRVRAPEVRIAAHARLIRRLGLGKASQELERSRMIEMQAGALRVQFDRTLETRNGLLMATSAAQHNADGVPAWRRLRHERERSRDRRQRFVVAVEPGEPACQLRLRLGIARIDRAGLTDLREAFGDAARSAASTPRSRIDEPVALPPSRPQRSKR